MTLSPARLAEIKLEADTVRELPAEEGLMGQVGAYAKILGAMLDDLLAAFDRERARADEAECFAARFALDEHSVQAGMQSERAAIVARLEEKAEFFRRMGGEESVTSQCHAFAGGAFGSVARRLRERGDTRPPPHEATLARLRRLEAAARALLEVLPEIVGREMRAALEEVSKS